MDTLIKLTVFNDAVKTEVESYGYTSIIGWFRDELSGLCAACEREIMRSAILPELRKLPEMKVETIYKPEMSRHAGVRRFTRGTAFKKSDVGRRVVLLPGASGKPWLCA